MRAWQPTPVFLPGEPHGQRSLTGYGPQSCRVRLDWSDLAHTSWSLFIIWHVQIIDIKYNPLYSQVITKLCSLASVFPENIRVWNGRGYSWNSVKISCLKLVLVLLSAEDWLLRNAIFQTDTWANSIAVLSLFLNGRCEKWLWFEYI